jgi:hypothetical protein
MNPAGAIEHEGGGRTYYSSFRWAFQAAGFEVVDCPRLTRMKNAADLASPSTPWTRWPPRTRYDEFTLLSSDADFVPLLLRLRAADRRTRLVAHPELGAIVRAAADEVIGLDRLAARLGWAHSFGPDAAPDIIALVRDIMAEAEGPMHLPHLGQMIRQRTGQTLRGSDFGGTGSLEALLEAAGGLLRQEGPGGGHVLRRDQGRAQQRATGRLTEPRRASAR